MVLEKEKELLNLREEELDPINQIISHLESAVTAARRIDYPVCGKDREVYCVDVSALVRSLEDLLARLYATRRQMGAIRIVTPDIEGMVDVGEEERKLIEEAKEWAD